MSEVSGSARGVADRKNGTVPGLILPATFVVRLSPGILPGPPLGAGGLTYLKLTVSVFAMTVPVLSVNG